MKTAEVRGGLSNTALHVVNMAVTLSRPLMQAQAAFICRPSLTCNASSGFPRNVWLKQSFDHKETGICCFKHLWAEQFLMQLKSTAFVLACVAEHKRI